MLRRLVYIRKKEPQIWNNLICCQRQNLKTPYKNYENITRFSTCLNINYNSIKPNDSQLKNSVIHKAVITFKSNPYVRLMRLDKPIGKSK